MKLTDILGQKIVESDCECWVYGLGTSGRLFIDLCKNYGYPIVGIIVGNGYKTESFYKGIALYEPDQIGDDICSSQGKTILFYTVKQEKGKILDKLKWNTENIVDISSKECYQHMLRIYYMDYFKKKNIQTQIENDDILNFGGYRCVNPKVLKKGYMYDDFLSEAGDLILPPVFSDYDRIDEGAYEDGLIKIKKDSVVIDCGANMGLFSAIAAWRGGKVYAFEPVEEVFQYLKMQVGVYPESIYPIRKALSDFCGTGEIYLGEAGNLTENSLYEKESFKKELIECTTLDSFVEENNIDKVDFIKADIEGAERAMLRGARNVLAKHAPKLSICTYHREDDREVLSGIILESNPNYKIIHKWKKLYAYVEEI